MSYLFECSLHINSLAPGSSRVCQTIPSISSPWNINFLSSETSESFSHHQNSIVSQSRGVLSMLKCIKRQMLKSTTLKSMGLCGFMRKTSFPKSKNGTDNSLVLALELPPLIWTRKLYATFWKKKGLRVGLSTVFQYVKLRT